MASVIVYYVHPGQQHSHSNLAMQQLLENVEGIESIDLYREYPRFIINIDKEQQRLLDHDVVVLQFPVFWYSGPALLKEWIDLVFEHGFAYGSLGNSLLGKRMLLAVTAGRPEQAYTAGGNQNHSLRTLPTTFQQTVTLCKMKFMSPYVLYDSLSIQDSTRIDNHAQGFVQLIESLRDDKYNLTASEQLETIGFERLPQLIGANS